MKLSEVIAQLEQFPEKEFIGEIGESTPIILKNIGGTNLYAAYENGDKVKSTVSLKRIWKEIKQPVTWQEAMQAWTKGKCFTIILRSFEYYQCPTKKLGCLKLNGTTDVAGFDDCMFTDGQWYID